MAALVWMALVTAALPGSSTDSGAVLTGRSRALTMPVVTVPESPKGLPMAITGSPTESPWSSPIPTAAKSEGASLTCSTARSVEGSEPVTSAG